MYYTYIDYKSHKTMLNFLLLTVICVLQKLTSKLFFIYLYIYHLYVILFIHFRKPKFPFGIIPSI